MTVSVLDPPAVRLPLLGCAVSQLRLEVAVKLAPPAPAVTRSVPLCAGASWRRVNDNPAGDAVIEGSAGCTVNETATCAVAPPRTAMRSCPLCAPASSPAGSAVTVSVLDPPAVRLPLLGCAVSQLRLEVTVKSAPPSPAVRRSVRLCAGASWRSENDNEGEDAVIEGSAGCTANETSTGAAQPPTAAMRSCPLCVRASSPAGLAVTVSVLVRPALRLPLLGCAVSQLRSEVTVKSAPPGPAVRMIVWLCAAAPCRRENDNVAADALIEEATGGLEA